MSNGDFNWNKFNLPAWLITVVVCALAVGVAKADVAGLKKDVEDLKPLASAVAVINSEIPSMKNDIQEIKQSQKDIQVQQMNFQQEIQRDIKTLLQRNR